MAPGPEWCGDFYIRPARESRHDRRCRTRPPADVEAPMATSIGTRSFRSLLGPGRRLVGEGGLVAAHHGTDLNRTTGWSGTLAELSGSLFGAWYMALGRRVPDQCRGGFDRQALDEGGVYCAPAVIRRPPRMRAPAKPIAVGLGAEDGGVRTISPRSCAGHAGSDAWGAVVPTSPHRRRAQW